MTTLTLSPGTSYANQKTTAIFPDLSRYDRIALDTETTGLGHKDKAVSIGLALPDGQKFYYAFGHPDGNNCSVQQVRDWAKKEFRPDLLTIFINAVYDMRMMQNVQIPLPNIPEDIGIIAALLNEHEQNYTLEGLCERHLGLHKNDQPLLDYLANKFGGKATRKTQAKNYHKAPGWLAGEYGGDDAELTMKFYDHSHRFLWDEGLMPVYVLESQLIPVLLRMYNAGVKVDVAKARATQLKFRTEGERLKQEWDALVGPNVNTNSTQQLAKIFDRFNIPYGWTEPSSRFPNGQASITADILETIEHPIGMMLRKMRQLEHYDSTFIENYLIQNLQDGDFIHPQFHQVKGAWGGTVTGRFSSAGGLNAQNVPSRDEELAPMIRGMFIPMSKDHQWLKVDESQIEYRFFAHYAGGQLRRAYIENPYIDFHEMVAAMTGLKRKAAKNINFGILYGMGVEKTARKLGISVEDAQLLLDQYDQRVPEARRLYRGAMNRGNQRGYIITWGGRKNRFRYVGERRKKYIGTHTALNKLLQGSAADLIKRAMLDVDQEIDWQSEVMHLTVHDELDLSVLKGKAGRASALKVKAIMESYELTVPLLAEAELGPDWGHTAKLLAA